MKQIPGEPLESTKRVASKLHTRNDGPVEDEQEAFDLDVRRLVAGHEEYDTQGYRWREDVVTPPPFVDPWDGKPYPWALPIPPATNP